MDWVTAAVLGEETPIKVGGCIALGCGTGKSCRGKKGDEIARDVLEHWNTETVYDEELRKHLEEQGSFLIRIGKNRKCSWKFTVSELKKHAYLKEESGEILYEEPEMVPLIRNLCRKPKIKGRVKGSAYHKVLELLDFSEEYKREKHSAYSLENRSGDFRKRDGCRKKWQTASDYRIFCGFEQRSRKRMRAAARAGCLWESSRLCLGSGIGDLSGDQSEEMILVQGSCGVCFEGKRRTGRAGL